MINYSFYNKEYLLGIKPSHKYIPIIVFVSIIAIFILISSFKTYDVNIFKGFIECNEKCSINLGVNIDDINKIKQAKDIMVNDEIISYKDIIVGDIEIDEVNKINIQNVSVELEQTNNDYNNTIQDIKVYSNYESIFEKLKKIIL